MTIHLQGQSFPRAELSAVEVAQMYQLFQEHYAQTTPSLFERDLTDKNWVIVLREPASGAIQGFSTLAFYTTQVENQAVGVVYSGDTIIRPAFWGTPELPRTWIKTVMAQAAALPQPCYWLLISSGYKTYRFLTVFFREFYPRHDCPTPPHAQHLIDHLASERFGADYHAADGVVRFQIGATPLRNGLAEIDARRLKDPHVAFFNQRNPNHARGDELVCLTRLEPGNFTAAGRRMAR
jgi:hypothetical protein